MDYRIGKDSLFDRFSAWNGFLKKKVHLVACGGTAMTLLDVKESTKDIDLIVPRRTEYEYLVRTLEQLGYRPATGNGWSKGDGFIFELFPGKRIFTTELLDSPLKEGNHFLIKELSHIYLGALNYYDLLISKLFRSSGVDIEDCLQLFAEKGQEIDLDRFVERFRETASFDISQGKANKRLDHFLRILQKRGPCRDK